MKNGATAPCGHAHRKIMKNLLSQETSTGALQAETAFAVRLDVAFWGRVRWRVTSPALVFRCATRLRLLYSMLRRYRRIAVLLLSASLRPRCIEALVPRQLRPLRIGRFVKNRATFPKLFYSFSR